MISANQKIAIVGYGREGKSLANFLLKQGMKNIVVLDQNQNLVIDQPLKFRLGKNYLENLADFDLIYVSPGISINSRKWDKVKDRISSPTNLFFNLCPAKVVGVTGTKGKGTVCRLLKKITEKEWPQKVFLGGNIGYPLISLLGNLDSDDLVIAELSSFQLQILKISPPVAVITNLSVDHLNYHRTVQEYHQAKLNILRYQSKNDFAVMNLSLLSRVEKIGSGKRFYFSLKRNNRSQAYYYRGWLIIRDGQVEKKIIKENEIKVLGGHNRENVLAAVLVSYLLGVPVKKISQGVSEFKLSEHHLELVLDKDGIKVINDSAATNPLAMIAAVKSFNRPIILIAGGQDKGFNYSQLGKEFEKEKGKIKSIILLGENKNKMSSIIPAGIEKIRVDLLNQAVEAARLRVESGDLILFSPGAASLDMFNNAQERGESFKKLIVSALNSKTEF